MKFCHISFRSLGLLVLITLMATACVSTRKAIYFNGLNDGTITSQTPVPEPVIQKNDLLSILVTSLNPEASAIFNSQNISIPNNSSVPGVSYGASAMLGYLVNSEGKIQFPILGNIKAEGLTKEQLKEDIVKKILDQKLAIDPIVSIRFLNFRVTVLGEVKNPTVISVPNEKISLLEAIGLAGDLTIFAERDNVLIIREENGDKLIKRLNLNSEELLTSPFYYLKSNDIVYVEPNRAKIASAARGQQWIPAVLSGLSAIVVIADRIKF
ncbi:MAG TPA: polysaccharide biosynthesis/export family protein [Chitinophagaceae bacterium]|nr:polysaccharide biosynthesis/export family protein [Chitinophagaceae bacterium]